MIINVCIIYTVQISNADVWEYDGVGKPSHFEIIFKAVSDDSTPPDLTAMISFDEVLGKPTTTITLTRSTESPPSDKDQYYSGSFVTLLQYWTIQQ